ncbi:MAG: DNA polymerase [Ilumatobacteraceae bacterium]
MVSYGLAYGMEAYGLGQRLNIPTDEAAKILDAYFEAFPNVKAYMDATVQEAHRTATPRRCSAVGARSPSCSSSNWRIRQAGERQAMSASIQGLLPASSKWRWCASTKRSTTSGWRANSSCRCTTR